MTTHFEALVKAAHLAGLDAVETAKVTMVQAVDDGIGYVSEPFPICGYAWIKVRPANSSFGRWLKKAGIVDHVSYSGGYDIWVSLPTQSYDLKYAYAQAYARVLKDAGINAYAGGRLD